MSEDEMKGYERLLDAIDELRPEQSAESDYTAEQRRTAIQRMIDLLAAGKSSEEAAAEVRASLTNPPGVTK